MYVCMYVCMYINVCIYIYIYEYTHINKHIGPAAFAAPAAAAQVAAGQDLTDTGNLRTNIMDFRVFDSSRILILRGGLLMSKGNFPEDLSQAILVGIMLVGRLGVATNRHRRNGYLAQRVRT